jgi:two-component system chemotaxis response regulator CheY
MNILVVDDSLAMRMIVVRTMRKAGVKDHNFTEAVDGAAALAAIRQSPPDLVMSDWNMPNMTGIELLRTLRAEGNEIPFGFVTSEFTDEMREAARASGALFLIAKPFTEDDFREILEPHIA